MEMETASEQAHRKYSGKGTVPYPRPEVNSRLKHASPKSYRDSPDSHAAIPFQKFLELPLFDTVQPNPLNMFRLTELTMNEDYKIQSYRNGRSSKNSKMSMVEPIVLEPSAQEFRTRTAGQTYLPAITPQHK